MSILNRVQIVFLMLVGTSLASAQNTPPTRLTLDMATEILLQKSPILLRERQNVAIATAGVTEARQRPNPVLDVDSESYPLFEPKRGSFWNGQELSARVGQPIEMAGKRRKRTAVAEQELAVGKSSLQDVIRQLKFELKSRYYSAALAKSQHSLAQQVLDEFDKVLKVNEVRYKQGEISGFEFSRLQTERLRFFNDLVEADLQLRNANAALLELIGADPSAKDFEVAEDIATIPLKALPQDLQQEAEQNRPDLAAQRNRVERDIRQTSLQKALAVPDITPSFGYKRDFGINTAVVGVSVPLPLFSRNQGGIARAAAQLELQRRELDRVNLGVRRDVQQALNAVDAQNRRVSELEGTYVPSARRARDIAQASYRLGALDLIGFLDVQRSYRETLRTYNQALYEQRVAVSSLEAAIGKDFGK